MCRSSDWRREGEPWVYSPLINFPTGKNSCINGCLLSHPLLSPSLSPPLTLPSHPPSLPLSPSLSLPSLPLSQDWQEVWLKDCFWHFLFCFILVVIMIIWRPSANSNRFAYSLVNDLEQEDDDEEEEIENKNFGEGVVCLLHCLFTCFLCL